MKSKIKIYLLLIALGTGFVSCLDKYPDDAIQAGQAIKMPIRQLLAFMRHSRMLRFIADV